MDGGRNLFSAFVTGTWLYLETVCLLQDHLESDKMCIKCCPYTLCFTLSTLYQLLAEFQITNAAHDASVALHSCVRFWGC